MTSTYFLDIDGVLVEHKGSLTKQMGTLTLLENTKNLLNSIEKNGSKIILTTGRKNSMKYETEKELSKLGIFYDDIIMGCNRGARILVNDLKPDSNIKTAFSFSPERNKLSKDELEKIIQPYEERPWGNFSTLAYSSQYHIKEIKVHPGKSSSLQSHDFRDETWLIVQGSGVCVKNEENIPVVQGSVVRVSRNDKHRIVNNSEEDLIFIEIQTGEKFSENDIVRYEDQFGRC